MRRDEMFTVLSPSRTGGGAEQQIKAQGREGNRHFSIQKENVQVYSAKSALFCASVDESVREVSKSCIESDLWDR